MHKAFVQYLQPAIEANARAPRTVHDAKKPKLPTKAATGMHGHDIAVLAQHLKPQLAQKTGEAFDRMKKATLAATATGLGEVLGIKFSTLGKDLEAVAETVRAANIALVENAARDYAEQVSEIFGDPNNFGLRVEELAQLLQERSGVSESRAELIARDQSLKFLGAVNEERQTQAGVDSYIWSTSNDERVRDEHAILEGETFEWSSPPEPGHPGEDIQCRCIAIPVIPELEGI